MWRELRRGRPDPTFNWLPPAAPSCSSGGAVLDVLTCPAALRTARADFQRTNRPSLQQVVTTSGGLGLVHQPIGTLPASNYGDWSIANDLDREAIPGEV